MSTQEKPPREFWIEFSDDDQGEYAERWSETYTPERPDTNSVHVIEYSAYESLAQTLKTYADSLYKTQTRESELRRERDHFQKKYSALIDEASINENKAWAIAEKTKAERDALKAENSKLQAQLYVAKDSSLRTYDGLSERAALADKWRNDLDEAIAALESIKEHQEHLIPQLPQVSTTWRIAADVLAKLRGREGGGE